MPEIAEQELVQLSQYAARDVLLVQGGGGNTSVKSADGARMWIKASGLRLAEVSLRRGYLETDLPALLGLLRDERLAGRPRGAAHAESVQRVQQAVRGNGHLRPSLETTFHAVLGPAVLHTHPVYVNAFTCMEGGAAALAEAGEAAAVWTPYEPPGYALGRAVDKVVRDHQAATGLLPGLVVLENHGLTVSGETAVEAIAETERFVAVAERFFGPLPEGAAAQTAPPGRLLRWGAALEQALNGLPGGARRCVRVARSAALLEAANNPDEWLSSGPLAPDDVVYNGPQVHQADIDDSPLAWLENELESVPQRMAIAVRGCGVVLVGPSQRTLEAMEENLLAHVLVRWLIAARRGRARPLPPEEIEYLQAMESEKYRQTIAAGQATST